MLPFKSFPLLSVILVAASALVTATVACSSSSSGTDDTAGDGGPDGAKDAKTDSPIIDDDSGPTICPQTTPITADEIEQVVDWKPPTPTQAVCGQQNIDDLKALFTSGNGQATFTDIKSALGATCADCTFTQITAPNWGVFVEDDAGTIDNGVASCFAEIDGNACGKAAFEFSGCLNIACNTDVCADASAVTACKTKAAKGACSGLNTAVSTACAGLQTDVNACSTLFQAIVETCAGGADGGVDAASP